VDLSITDRGPGVRSGDDNTRNVNGEILETKEMSKVPTEIYVIDDEGLCPNCGADWKDKPIPKKDRHFYDGHYYSRLIGVEYSYSSPEQYDGVSEWLCPDCAARFGRWTGKLLAEGEEEKRFGGS
jgi:hypothetical protein